jgi:queuosine precursor transporter
VRVLLYLVSIVAANVVTAAFQPLHIGLFIVPMGTLLIGGTFIFRDLVQNKHGRIKTYLFIGIALILSAAFSGLHGDPLNIVFASAISFLFSEASDTEIYSRLSVSMAWRVFYSGLVGGTLDSVIFVIVGLSPLGAGMLSWRAVPLAILGQWIVKIAIQGIGAMVLGFIKSPTEKNIAAH